jgi:hypothetical protein
MGRIKAKWNLRKYAVRTNMSLSWLWTASVNMVMEMCGSIRGTVNDKERKTWNGSSHTSRYYSLHSLSKGNDKKYIKTSNSRASHSSEI